MEGSASVRRSLQSGTLVTGAAATVALRQNPEEEEGPGVRKRKVLDEEQYIEVYIIILLKPVMGGQVLFCNKVSLVVEMVCYKFKFCIVVCSLFVFF